MPKGGGEIFLMLILSFNLILHWLPPSPGMETALRGETLALPHPSPYAGVAFFEQAGSSHHC